MLRCFKKNKTKWLSPPPPIIPVEFVPRPTIGLPGSAYSVLVVAQIRAPRVLKSICWDQ